MKGKKDKIHIDDIKRIRRIINSIIVHLEENVVNPVVNNNLSDNEEVMKQVKLLIGGRENITSAITKLSNLLIKIIPLEEEENQEFDIEKYKKLSDEDMDIIKRYIKKVGEKM